MKNKKLLESAKQVELSKKDVAELNKNEPSFYVHVPKIVLGENVVAENENWTEEYNNDFYVNEGKEYFIKAEKNYDSSKESFENKSQYVETEEFELKK